MGCPHAGAVWRKPQPGRCAVEEEIGLRTDEDNKEEVEFVRADDGVDVTHPEGVDTRIPLGADSR